MKRIKKMLSIMLTMAMTLAMTVTAFAADKEPSGSPAAPTPTPVSHTYEIYQIFTGDYDAATKALSNVKWGQNAKDGETVGKDVDETTLEAIEALKDTEENARAAALAAYANLDGAPFKENVTGVNNNQITVEGVPEGYYLIKDVNNSQGTGENANYSLYMVQVSDGTLTFNPKVGVPEVDKVIKVNGEDEKDSNGAIGDTVNYQFTGTMPGNIDLYNTYFYKFTDTLSKGLQYNNDIKVEIVNGDTRVDATKYFFKTISDYNEVTGTTIIVGMEDIKRLAVGDDTQAAIASITENTTVVVTYSATIRENAVVGNPGNPNKVDLEYSNNPNDSGTGATTPPPEEPDEPTTTPPTGKTPESEVVTYTTELAITKTMEGGGLPTGVEFTLTGTNLNKVNVEKGEQFVKVTDGTGTYYKLKDGTYTTQAPITDTTTEVKANTEYYESTTPEYKKVEKSTVTTEQAANNKVVGTVGEDGKLTFAGLSAGDYTLEETETPDGYNKINNIEIKIEYNNGKFTVTWKQVNENNQEVTGNGTGDKQVIVDDTDNTFSTTIENKSGSLLPSTGGIGTTIFYIVGAILVVGAAILLVTKKRMSKEA